MRVVAIDKALPEQAVIAEAASELVRGRLVAFPTETVYGLGALATNDAAIRRVFETKERPANHPLIAHVLNEDQARLWSRSWSSEASALARAFWPGPLTIIVPKAMHVSNLITAGGDSIALRAPTHPVARALITAVSSAIVAPSANRYQTLSPTRAEHVVHSLGDADVLVLDGGACPVGIESTVIDVSQPGPRVLRLGQIALVALRKILPEVIYAGENIREDLPRASPGMDARHYAPRLPLTLMPTRDEAIELAKKRNAALVTFGACPQAHYVLPLDPDHAARDLYALLHAIDRSTATAIVIENPPNHAGWDALRDRLTRASS